MNSESSYDSTFAMCVSYLAIGTLSVFANFLNLSMYIHSKEARKKYTGFIALEIGELINSVSFILTGAGRLESLKNDHLNAPTTTHSCFYGRYWPHAQILGTELPTLFLILTSFERCLE
ncbi:hypothetical protein PENTCL1PPCAC_12068 [Pristionchus entomophagus]|uniref:G protein-coupled receptor n=1 Tax=Pristionchus entomophagus TaxID=358040 RepID=A0AAV5TAP6_9BILA|nr:hypothetical protein PENTCL1PPCAC_12068 [Pristionchus entomophagus]